MTAAVTGVRPLRGAVELTLAGGGMTPATATRSTGCDRTSPGVWARLPLHDRRRFLRERARAWEIRRHRMAPEVGAARSARCAPTGG